MNLNKNYSLLASYQMPESRIKEGQNGNRRTNFDNNLNLKYNTTQEKERAMTGGEV